MKNENRVENGLQKYYSPETGEKDKKPKQKAQFLLAADLVLPDLLTFNYQGRSLIDSLSAELPTEESFQLFCMTVVTIERELDPNQENTLTDIVGVRASELPTFDPIPEKLARELAARPKRPAKETSRAKRQPVR